MKKGYKSQRNAGSYKLTWNANMTGISIFPLSFGFGPSINFLSTKIPLLPFSTTSVIVLTKLGIQAVPFGRICDQKNQRKKRTICSTTIKEKQHTNIRETFSRYEDPEEEYQPFHHFHSCYIFRCSQPKPQELLNPERKKLRIKHLNQYVPTQTVRTLVFHKH